MQMAHVPLALYWRLQIVYQQLLRQDLYHTKDKDFLIKKPLRAKKYFEFSFWNTCLNVFYIFFASDFVKKISFKIFVRFET